VVPELRRDGDVAFPWEIWPHSSDCIRQPGRQLTLTQNEHGRQHVCLSQENQFGQEGTNGDWSPKEKAANMTAVVKIVPHPFHGGEPFERDVWLDTGVNWSLVSADLAELCGKVDDKNLSPLVACANSQVIRCTGLVTFNVEFEGNSMVVLAWVSPSIQGEVLLGYQTLVELGFV
jgi:hypothetical protein